LDRPFRRLLAPLAVVALLLSVPVAAYGDPPDNPDGTAPASGSLQDQLAAATRAYVDAKGRLDTAVARQQQFQAELATANVRLAQLRDEVGVVAAATYEAGPLSTFAVILNSSSSDDFVARAETLHQITQTEDHQLRELNQLEASAAQTQAQLDQAVNTAKVQAAELERRKAQIQQALDVVAGGPTTGIPIPAPSAEPAPRNPDGSFPPEKCSVKDPTTSGCLTPRTLHALQQARLSGFTHYTACWRQSTWGEHPLGRACDFAADPGGFGGIATGASRDYGNRLAGYFIANASRLGVLYVIWYHQIWEPSRGWHYYKGDGTPSGDHMNHVHLSEI
jgi:peptidoglycan DL-endopeptidase CwlO